MVFKNARHIGLALLFTAMTGCGKKSEDKADEAPKEAAMTGTLQLSPTLQLLGYSLAVDSYKVFCVTFEATPVAKTGEIASTGAFSVSGLTTGVPFGCFINDKTTNATKGTMVVDNGSSTYGGTGESQSISLTSDVDLGQLTLGTDGKVKIPAAKLSGAKSAAAVTADNASELDELHAATYKMSCIDNGNAEQLATCKDHNDGQTVFFRVIKGTAKDGSQIRGIGAWASQAAFDICGSFDMGTVDADNIKASGYTLDSSVKVGTFTNQFDNSNSSNGGKTGAADKCYYRKQYSGETLEAGAKLPVKYIDNNYAMEEMKRVGSGWEMRQTNKYSYTMTHNGQTSGSCDCSESTTIVFNRKSSTEWAGAFNSEESCINTTAGSTATCGNSSSPQINSFNVLFSKQ